MTTVSVTTQPQQIQSGGQGIVTLINEGPATVYLDSDSSTSSHEGFPLRPLATMTWQEGAPLWAVTETGTATLNMNVSGYLSDPNRASGQRLLYRNVAFDQTARIDVGSYETLLVRFLAKPAGIPVSLNVFAVAWMDDHGNAIIEESITMWTVTGVATMNIPVKGASCLINVETTLGAGVEDVKIYGSTRTFPLTTSSYIPTASGTGSEGLEITHSRGCILVGNYQWGELWIPSWGSKLTIGFISGSAMEIDSEILVTDVEQYNAIYGRVIVEAGPLPRASVTIDVPASRPIKIQGTSGGSSSSANTLSLVWSDYV